MRHYGKAWKRLPRKQLDIADDLGVTESRVSQLLKRALERARDLMDMSVETAT